MVAVVAVAAVVALVVVVVIVVVVIVVVVIIVVVQVDHDVGSRVGGDEHEAEEVGHREAVSGVHVSRRGCSCVHFSCYETGRLSHNSLRFHCKILDSGKNTTSRYDDLMT